MPAPTTTTEEPSLENVKVPSKPPLGRPPRPVEAACERAIRTLCPTDTGARDRDEGEEDCIWMHSTTIQIDVCRGQTVRVPMYSDREGTAVVTWSPPGAVSVSAEGMQVAARPGEARLEGRRRMMVAVENRSHAATRVVVAMEVVVVH